MTFTEILQAIWGRELQVLAAIIVTTLAAGVYLNRETPSYRSIATVQLSTPSVATSNGATAATIPLVDTVPVAVTSRPVTALVAPGLAKLPGVSVSASLDSATNVMSVSARASVPSVAEAVANAYATAYVTYLRLQNTDQITALEAQQAKAETQVTRLGDEIAKIPTASGSTPSQQLLQAQFNAALATYSTLQTQLNQAEDAAAPATLAEDAAPGTSTLPSQASVLAIAALVGLIAGAGIALVRAQLDTRLGGPPDVEDSVGVPTLAELPFDRTERTSKRPLVILDRPQSSFAESIRELRTAVQVLLPGAIACPVVVVTSPEPSDGKTFVAANLAVSLALSGKRTILVSGDLRRPRVEGLFRLEAGTGGLATLIDAPATTPRNGSVWSGDQVFGGHPTREEVVQALVATDQNHLVLLPAGPSPQDPADLLASKQLQVLLAHLRDLADVVLIDTPPVLAVADSTIVGTLADGVVIVARANFTTRGVLEQTVKRLASANVNVLGVVLNQSQRVSNEAYPEYYSQLEAPGSEIEPSLVAPRRGRGRIEG